MCLQLVVHYSSHGPARQAERFTGFTRRSLRLPASFGQLPRLSITELICLIGMLNCDVFDPSMTDNSLTPSRFFGMSYPNSQYTSYDLRRLNSLEDFDNVIAGLKTELEKVTTLRNNYAPINRRLPPEVLCEIFLQLAKGCHAEYEVYALFSPTRRRIVSGLPNPSAWMTITHVCRHWREIALGFPSLWTSIHNKKPEYIRTFIARSRQAPLFINEHHNDSVCVREAFNNLLRERHRWRTFECIDPVLEWNDIDDAPQLEELRLCNPFRTPFMSPPAPSSFESPRLRRVEVESVPYSFIKSILKRDSITNLSLTGITPRQNPATWLDMLSLLPSLEELELAQVLQPSAHHPSSRRISFPKLRHLRLVEIDNGLVAATFLDMITLPSTARLSLEGRITSADHEHLLPLLKTICRYFTGSTTGAKLPREILACRMVSEKVPFQSFLSVDVWTTLVPMEAVSRQVRDPSPNISLRWGMDRANNAAVRRAGQIIFDTLPLSKLRLFHFSGLLSRILDRQQLGKLQSVRELYVDYTITAYFTTPEHEEAELLRPPSVYEGGPIPFPNLEHLTLRSVQWHRHPQGRTGTCSDDIVYDVRGILHRRKAAGLSLKSLRLNDNVNMYEGEVMALVRDGLVEVAEGYAIGMSSECPMCYDSEEEEFMDE